MSVDAGRALLQVNGGSGYVSSVRGLVQNTMEAFNACARIDALLASLDLARIRTPGELADLDAEIDRAFVGSLELRRAGRLKKGLLKKYHEEIRPLGLLTRRLFAGCSCEPNLRDSGNHDAVIRYPSSPGRTTLFVEFTCAKDGYEEHLRMKVLNDRGRVNLLTPVLSSGTESMGHNIEVLDEAVLRDRVLEKQSRLIIDRLKGKSRREYGRDDHILVVIFDDQIGFRTEPEFTLLRSQIEGAVDLSTLDFKSVYLLGSWGNVLWELPLASH